MPDDAPTLKPALSPQLAHVRKVEVVVNAASGGTDAGAADALSAMLEARGIHANVVDATPQDISTALRAAVDAEPDLLIVLAGDGTARLACELAGPNGPLVAPLPGGTMNMLPSALFGRRPWREALTELLDRGEVKPVSGGEVEGSIFFCGAIVGSTALWQPAREALRKGRMRRAWLHARLAMGRAFTRHLRFTLDGGTKRKARALSVMCPLVSRVMADDGALDVAALNPNGAGDALRLGARTLFTDILGDWRLDSAVEAVAAREVRLVGRRRAPALLDGEAQRLSRDAVIRFKPDAFRAVFLPEVDPHAAAAADRHKHQAHAAAGVAAAEAAGAVTLG